MTAVAPRPGALAAPDAAAVMAQAPSENFPVASRLLGAREREHLLALYGYARLVDDLGDEGAPPCRGELLDWLAGELDHVFGGTEPQHPLMRRLVPTVEACRMPRDPFDRLLAANRWDQGTVRCADADALLAYCRLSAAPVGELVLHVFDRASGQRIAWSDRICAALQIAEHMQDVAEDRARGRVYLPQDELARCGCGDADLQASTPSPAFRAVMSLQAARARALMREGAPLVRALPARPSLAVAGFLAGGHAAIDALERAGWDVLGAKPRPSRAAFAWRWLGTLARSGR